MRHLLLAAIVVAFAVATINPAAAISCREMLQQWEQAKAPKAWAVGSNRFCGSATAATTSSLAEAKAKAISYCQSSGGVGCKIVRSQP